MSYATARPVSNPPPTTANSSSQGFSGRALALIVGAVVVLVFILWLVRGNRGESLTNSYGRRSGANGSTSVNGTRVLAFLFEKLGYQTSTVQKLSPRLNKSAEVLVWFPDDFGPPAKEAQDFLEKWLAQGNGRTLIYVGRDYDAAPHYWRAAAPLAPTTETAKFTAQRASAQSHHEGDRSQMPKDEYARWFTIHGKGKKQQLQTLEGPWAEGLNAPQAMLEVEGRLDIPVPADYGTDPPPSPPYAFNQLLGSQGKPFITEIRRPDWNGGRIVVVANGSGLLNYPLVNHENRKLATRLIRSCQTNAPGNVVRKPQQVVFIESDHSGLTIVESEKELEAAGLQLLKVWPLNIILLHLILLGIVYCFSRTAIFGRPQTLPEEPQANFGKHVTALGQLLARSRDFQYAENRVAQYLQQAKRNSGKSHL